MYEDEFDLELNSGIDNTPQEESLSEQEMADIMGVEYVTENNEIEGLQTKEDPSLERLKKIKKRNQKKVEAKKNAELKAKQQSYTTTEQPSRRYEFANTAEQRYYSNENRQYEASTFRPGQSETEHSYSAGGNVFNSAGHTYIESPVYRESYQYKEEKTHRDQSSYNSYTEEPTRTQEKHYVPTENPVASEGAYRPGSSPNAQVSTSSDMYNNPQNSERVSYVTDIKNMDMRQSYTVEPEPTPYYHSDYASTNAQVSEANRQVVFEHTGNTPVADAVSRAIAGTVTESGAWVGCDILPTSEQRGYEAFNSRKEAEVVQPAEKPAEDAFRMAVEVQRNSDDISSVISRRTSDISLPDTNKPGEYNLSNTDFLTSCAHDVFEKNTVSYDAKMREVSEKEQSEQLPEKVTSEFLYAASADMDSKADRIVLAVEGKKPSFISGDSEIQVASSTREAASLLNKTPEGHISIKESEADTDNNASFNKDSEGSSLLQKSNDTKSRDVTLVGDKNKIKEVEKEGPVNEKTKEGETKDYRTIQEAAKRKFARENGQMWKDFCQSSKIVIDAVVSQLTPEDDAAVQTIKQGVKIVSSVNNFMSYWGASSAYNMITDRALDVAKNASLINGLLSDEIAGPSNLDKALKAIAGPAGEGSTMKLSLSDLSLSKNELKEKLKATGELSKKQIARILNNVDDIKLMLETKQILLDFATNTGKLSDDALNFINSKEFFNPNLFSKEFSSGIASFFANSSDPMLRGVNPASLSSKEIAKLLKKDSKLRKAGGVGFSEEERKVLEMLRKTKKAGKSLKDESGSHGVRSKIGGLFKMAKNAFLRLDDASAEGLRTVCKVFDGGRTALSMLQLSGRMTTWTVKFAGRIVFLNPLSRFVGRKIKQEAVIVKNTATTAIKATKPVKAATKAVSTVKGAINKNKQIISLKAKAEKIKNTAKKIGKKASDINNVRKKISRKVKSGMKKVGKVVRMPGKIIFAPFNAVARIWNAVSNFIKKKIILPILGVIGILFLFYCAVGCLTGILLGIAGTAERIVMLEPEEMQTLVDLLNTKTDAVYKEAKDIAVGNPISGKVYYDTKLYCYGSPRKEDDPTSEYYHNGATIDKSLLNGWHVYYLDSQGNILGSNVSNVKDIISAACAMMYNESDDVGEYENLVKDMWTGMVPVITACESDIYHTEYSTDSFPKDGSTYYCNDSEFYSQYDAANTEGVCFYDTVATRHLEAASDEGYVCTGSGCTYKEWEEWVLTCTKSEHTHGSGCDDDDCDHSCDEGCCSKSHPHKGSCDTKSCSHSCGSSCCSKDEHTHTKEAGCYTKVLHRDYYCPGHDALHCSYGYRDINVYVTLILKEDLYKSFVDENKCVIDYKVPTNFNCTAFEPKQATITFKNHWDGYKGKMKAFFDNGAWDYDMHVAHATMNAETGCLECNLPGITNNGGYSTGADATERCVGTIEWCDRLYNEDWFETYGVSVYSADSGLAAGGGSLTDEEKQAVIDNIISRYGDLDSARSSFVQFSLDYVGAISYWYGGKPSSKAWNSSWGTEAPKSNPYYDYNSAKGRTVLGLDCSGFVGWCYWNTFDVQPGCSTANFTTSLGLPQTSFMNLQPGDIGLTNVPGSSSNHIGIFVGFDENGKALWVHCNGSTANVAVNNYNGFRYYYKLIP